MSLSRLDAMAIVVLVLGAMPTAAQSESVLYSFPTSAHGEPQGRLLLLNGILYGTGSGNNGTGHGQVFALGPTGTGEHSLFAFDFTDGAYPFAGLLSDSSGALYGTTWGGGAYDSGAVYKLTKSGTSWAEHVIWSFGKTSTDGAKPECDLVMDTTGALYGTTPMGGTSGDGTVFELTQAGGKWTEHVLHSFKAGNDGQYPYAGLFRDHAGALYGTTAYGGAADSGTIFRLTESNGVWRETVLHAFSGGSDGERPAAALIAGPNGVYYGTTQLGGEYNNGTVFKLSLAGGVWSEQVLFSFGGGTGGSGSLPAANLRLSGSTLYGTTQAGGSGGGGTVFELSPSGGVWKETVLHSFATGGDGLQPDSAVVMDSSGALYGTTQYGGANGFGTVYKIIPP